MSRKRRVNINNVILMSVNGDRVSINVEISRLTNPQSVYEAIVEGYAVVPFGWELGENVYRLWLVMPTYFDSHEVIYIAMAQLNDWIIKFRDDAKLCMVSDDELGNMIKDWTGNES